MKKKRFFNSLPGASVLMLSAAIAMSGNARAQVTIGADFEPQPFSILELESVNGTRGLRLPQLTTAERIALEPSLAGNPQAPGLQVFDTSTRCIYTWNGTKWIAQCPPEGETVYPVPYEAFDCVITPKSGSNTQYTAKADPNAFAYEFFVDGKSQGKQSSNVLQLTSNANASTVKVRYFYTEDYLKPKMIDIPGNVGKGAGGENGEWQYSQDIASPLPVTKVAIPDFKMGETEVTQAQFEYVMGNSTATSDATPNFACGSAHKGAAHVANRPTSNLPVEYVNWYAAIAYCNKLSLLEGLETCYSVKVSGNEVDWEHITINSEPFRATATDDNWDKATCDFSKKGYRLPTGWEWEYAARGGMQKAHPRIAGSYYDVIISCSDLVARDSLCLVAWFGDNNNTANGCFSTASGVEGTKPVKTKRANVFGLYDMAGNIDEWCYEWYDRKGDEGVISTPFRTPIGIDTQPTSSSRILKGGSWFHGWSSSCTSYRVGQRSDAKPYIYKSSLRGFRVVMSK